MNISIVGGGNIGTQFAVHCAKKLHRVTIYSSRPECFRKHLSIVDENGNVTCQGDIFEATSNAEKVFSDADIIFITVPAFCMKDIAVQMAAHIKRGVKIGIIPGTGGGECVFRTCMEGGAIVFGIQRVPGVARLVEYGRSVCATGYRSELYAAAFPHTETEEVVKLISDIFDIPCVALPNYLSLTLTPSNPILHTTRLRTLFSDYQDGMTYDSVPLFYEEWTDDASRLLFRCDDEVQQICRALEGFDLHYVKSLKVHYESDTPEKLTEKMKSIKGFRGLKAPMTEIRGKYVPDLHSRFFVADFSYGLQIFTQIAGMAGVSVPNMQQILDWYDRIALEKNRFLFSEYGIKDIEQLKKFYTTGENGITLEKNSQDKI